MIESFGIYIDGIGDQPYMQEHNIQLMLLVIFIRPGSRADPKRSTLAPGRVAIYLHPAVGKYPRAPLSRQILPTHSQTTAWMKKGGPFFGAALQ